jgi:O-antigen/teichoic acid export membrane protein
LKIQFQQLFFGKLARASSWIFSGAVAVGIFGYFFQIIIGRMLTISEYGTFSALMAIMMLLGAPINTLTMVVARKVSAYRADKYDNHRSHLFFIVNKRLLIFSVVPLIFLLFYMEPLKSILVIEKNLHFYLLLFLFFLTLLQATNNAFLQGLQYFKWISASGILNILFKIIIAIFLIKFGFGVSGVIGAVVISTMMVIVLVYFILRPSISKRNHKFSGKMNFTFKAALPVLIANISFAVMTQIDIVLVKHYFSEQDVGIYAAASILGKAVMYLPSGITIALFPMVAENHSKNQSSSHLIIQAFMMTSALCIIGAIIYFFFSESIILLLFGEGYIQAAPILKYFGFAMLPMALILVAEHFLIAMGKVLFAYLFMIIAPLQLIAIYYNHESLLGIVFIVSISGITLALIGYSLLWREFIYGKKITKL